ncbi:hypothetical protein Barb7_02248 [Bacteroidales bacterium Barb7]|nr:hypothetical protein Barb7_02248 [Bacteroidales bacterium Barb7]
MAKVMPGISSKATANAPSRAYPTVKAIGVNNFFSIRSKANSGI